jgi:hypothetical protein
VKLSSGKWIIGTYNAWKLCKHTRLYVIYLFLACEKPSRAGGWACSVREMALPGHLFRPPLDCRRQSLLAFSLKLQQPKPGMWAVLFVLGAVSGTCVSRIRRYLTHFLKYVYASVIALFWVSLYVLVLGCIFTFWLGLRMEVGVFLKHWRVSTTHFPGDLDLEVCLVLLCPDEQTLLSPLGFSNTVYGIAFSVTQIW